MKKKKNSPGDYRPLVLLIIGALAGGLVGVIGAVNENYAMAVAGMVFCAGSIGVVFAPPSSGSSD